MAFAATALQHGYLWPAFVFLLDFVHRRWPWSPPLMDIALKINVVAVCAVFVFLGAIILGAF
jgi:hypothetical protein